MFFIHIFEVKLLDFVFSLYTSSKALSKRFIAKYVGLTVLTSTTDCWYWYCQHLSVHYLQCYRRNNVYVCVSVCMRVSVCACMCVVTRSLLRLALPLPRKQITILSLLLFNHRYIKTTLFLHSSLTNVLYFDFIDSLQRNLNSLDTVLS